ncbi:hypothetical protein D3C86_2096150 [compost metagenome]
MGDASPHAAPALGLARFPALEQAVPDHVPAHGDGRSHDGDEARMGGAFARHGREAERGRHNGQQLEETDIDHAAPRPLQLKF